MAKAKKINLNVFAKDLAKCEGLKVQLPIGQIKELIKCAFLNLICYTDEEIMATINWYLKKYTTKKKK